LLYPPACEGFLVASVKRFLSNTPLWSGLNILLFGALVAIHFAAVPKPAWWNDGFAIAVNILAGGLVSFFFYWLVVYAPEARKKNVIKCHLVRMYRNIKRDILYQVVFASQKGGRTDLVADEETMDALMTTDGFRTAFENGTQRDEGFYAFENQMSEDTYEFRAIVLNLELLSKQIEFVLHNYTLEDERLFGFFKRLEVILLKIRHAGPGYEESKPLCSFIYEVFAGWDIVKGYVGHDRIETTIAEI